MIRSDDQETVSYTVANVCTVAAMIIEDGPRNIFDLKATAKSIYDAAVMRLPGEGVEITMDHFTYKKCFADVMRIALSRIGETPLLLDNRADEERLRNIARRAETDPLNHDLHWLLKKVGAL